MYIEIPQTTTATAAITSVAIESDMSFLLRFRLGPFSNFDQNPVIETVLKVPIFQRAGKWGQFREIRTVPKTHLQWVHAILYHFVFLHTARYIPFHQPSGNTRVS